MRLWCRCSETISIMRCLRICPLRQKEQKVFLSLAEANGLMSRMGIVQEWRKISDLNDYKFDHPDWQCGVEAEENGEKRIIVRLTMQHAVRYAYIAKVLNDLAADEPVRIYNDEPEPVCEQCGGPLVPGTRHCRHCVSKTEALLKLMGVAKGYWRPLTLAFALLIMGSVLSLLGSLLSKIAGQRCAAAAGGPGPRYDAVRDWHWRTCRRACRRACADDFPRAPHDGRQLQHLFRPAGIWCSAGCSSFRSVS